MSKMHKELKGEGSAGYELGRQRRERANEQHWRKNVRQRLLFFVRAGAGERERDLNATRPLALSIEDVFGGYS